MNRSEEEFFKFNTRKVIFLAEKYAEQFKAQEKELNQIKQVASMRDFLKG